MTDNLAPDGTIWVCATCGKTARHRHGRTKEHQASPGWDESCMLNAVLCHAEQRGGMWQAVIEHAEPKQVDRP